jgi:hypothetical protein
VNRYSDVLGHMLEMSLHTSQMQDVIREYNNTTQRIQALENEVNFYIGEL